MVGWIEKNDIIQTFIYLHISTYYMREYKTLKVEKDVFKFIRKAIYTGSHKSTSSYLRHKLNIKKKKW